MMTGAFGRPDETKMAPRSRASESAAPIPPTEASIGCALRLNPERFWFESRRWDDTTTASSPLRSWSARSAENREVLVRSQGVRRKIAGPYPRMPTAIDRSPRKRDHHFAARREARRLSVARREAWCGAS
jgi:hypothetical protein